MPADVYAFPDRRLHSAVRSGRISALREALRDGSPADALGFNRETALHWAAALNDLEATRLLLGSTDCGAGIEDADGRTPLKIAIGRGHAEAAALLAEAESIRAERARLDAKLRQIADGRTPAA